MSKTKNTEKKEENQEVGLKQHPAFDPSKVEVEERLESSAEYHDFSEQPVFYGQYVSEFIAGEEPKLLGYVFINLETNEEVIITNSYSVTKAVTLCVEEKGLKDFRLRIEFKGKTENSKGQQVNLFKIDLIK